MNCDKFYNTTSTALNIRESFNNTILLMIMVKSEYYYIIGFSRPNNTITIGFDYDSPLHKTITEFITIDFNQSNKEVIFTCKLDNIDRMCNKLQEVIKSHSGFEYVQDSVLYKETVEIDKLIPISIETMDEYIVAIKNKICSFLEGYYKTKLR